MNNWNNNEEMNENAQVISKNIQENDSQEVKNVKERIYYARVAYGNAKTKENVDRIGKELDVLLAKLETLQPKKKSQWDLFQEKHRPRQGGKRKTMRRKHRKGRKHTRKH